VVSGTGVAGTAVDLPDSWAGRGDTTSGRGRYVLRLDLDRVPERPWAMRLDRLSSRHLVRVNGVVLADRLSGPTTARPKPVPALLSLPAPLLRAGENLIEIEIEALRRGGLSPVWVGEVEAFEDGWETAQLRDVTLPQLLNVASGAVSLFMLMLWWRRRGEAALGTFSVIGLLTSVRNYGYSRVTDTVPMVVVDWLYYAAQVVSVCMLGYFAMAFTGRRPAWFHWTLRALLGGLLLAGTVLAGWDLLDPLRAVSYPVLMGVGATALVLITLHVRAIGWRGL